MCNKDDNIKFQLYNTNSVDSLLKNYKVRNKELPYILEDSGVQSFEDKRYNTDYYIEMYDKKTNYGFNKDEIKSILLRVRYYILSIITKDIVDILLTEKMLNKIVICSDGSYRYSRVLFLDTGSLDYISNYDIAGNIIIDYNELSKKYKNVLSVKEELVGNTKNELEYIYNHFDKIFVQVPYYCLQHKFNETNEF